MPSYRNGYIPKELLVTFASGVNTAVGYWEHSLSPATYARHLALVERARARTGRTLAMGAGWSAYRPYDQQVKARQIYGNGAATPGTSSHGGFWERRQTLAMDYSNWSWVYGGDRAAFYADCRAVGLSPGLIEPSRGYPDEPWHVCDLQPWSAVPAGGGATPFDSSFTETESDMRVIKSPNRPWTLIGPGTSRVLSAEEAGNTVWPKHDLNDRQFDLNVAMSVGPVETQPVGGMVVIEDNAKVRPVALVGPGYYRALNDEEASNVGVLASRREVGNTRQYDLWVSIALAGQGASFPVAAANLSALSDADVQRLAEAAADEADRRDRERLGS